MFYYLKYFKLNLKVNFEKLKLNYWNFLDSVFEKMSSGRNLILLKF